MSSINLSFKALSDPTRRSIILLLKEKDLTAGEIAEHFDMTKPSISHHLNILKQSLLVTGERKGQNIYYSLNTTVFQEITSWIFNLSNVNKGESKNEKNS